MAIKKTQMYRKNLDTSETNLYPLTESQYVLMENGQTVQEILSDRDSDKYTPVITNSSSTFKVGQGDSVDLSSSMKEGAYDSCVLKGKTMVNCIQEPSSQDVVLPYEFEDGQYVTINDTKESGALGIELKGQTLVNLDKNTYPITNWGTNENSNNYFRDNTTLAGGMFKPATKYLFKIYGLSCNYDMVQLQGISGQFSQVWSTGFVFNKNGSLVLQSSDSIQTFTSYIPHFRRNDIKNLTEQDKQNFKMIILEYQEGMENWDIPYFTGMTSCKMPTLHTVGKNLFDGNLISGYYEDGTLSKIIGGNANLYKTIKLNLKKGTYTFSFEESVRFIRQLKDGVYNTLGGDFTKFTTTLNTDGIYVLSFRKTDNTDFDLTQIQVEENSIATSYEPYKSSILSLPEEVVLRSLPNGVCDTFNTRTGVYTQRIGEVVLNGSENWVAHTSGVVVDTLRFQYRNLNFYVKTNSDGGAIQTPNLRVVPNTEWNTDREQIELDINNRLGVRVLRNKLATQDVAGLRQYLVQNPITLQYQFKTPIITKINLSSTLKSWNTTTHIYSEIPENTLYPTLSHSNPSYPVILKPSTKYSIVANSYSNSHSNSAINFNLGGATASTTVGNRVTTITTPSTLSNELLTMSGRGNKLNNVMVIEGDVAGDEPYFEGICDCKSPILSNVGKNLVNPNLFEGKRYINNGNNVTLVQDESYSCYDIPIPAKKGDVFTWSTNNTSYKVIIEFDANGGLANYSSVSLKERTYTVQNELTAYIKIQTNVPLSSYLITEPQLEKSPTKTPYEPHKSNILSCETYFDEATQSDKTIVLRSLPNGVCDTLNVETGEYVQRIGEYRVTGGEEETYNTDGEAQYIYISNTSALMRMKNTSVLVCDKFPYNKSYSTYNYPKVSSTSVLIFVLPTSATGLSTKAEREAYIKNLAKTEGITVQYELATPIVTTIDVQGFPYAYTNGHVQLSSGSIEPSLTPTVEYSLSANKTGQINSNTKRVSAHQKQLDDFEAMMLTQMVQSAYDKAILQFDYEMQMMSLGGE